MTTTSSRNATRYDRKVVMKPPSSGPTAAAMAAAAPTRAYVAFWAAPSKLPWMSDCMAGSRSDAPRPPITAQKMNTGATVWLRAIARAPMAYASSPRMYASLRPMRSPTLLPMRMNAAETNASSAIADWTRLTVVPRSLTTAEIDTFMIDVSTTRTNIAIARRSGSRRSAAVEAGTSALAALVIRALRYRRTSRW